MKISVRVGLLRGGSAIGLAEFNERQSALAISSASRPSKVRSGLDLREFEFEVSQPSVELAHRICA
jgi:hypothetical protein